MTWYDVPQEFRSKHRCASDSCPGVVTSYFEHGDVGSHYCSACADKIERQQARGRVATIADYEEVLEDHRQLVQELDIALCGDGAAKQASLCDLIAVAEHMRKELDRLRVENIQLKFACGYPMPADLEHFIVPINPFRCGVCDARNEKR